jgi:hypothetical protein
METRMTTLETRFDTILPTLATKEDLKSVELKLTNMELKLTKTIHQEMNFWIKQKCFLRRKGLSKRHNEIISLIRR